MTARAPRETSRLAPPELLPRLGAVFATFDGRTQDSGNVSFGVEIDGRRWFVKTPGPPGPCQASLKHDERVALLRNATRLARTVSDPALPELRGSLPSAWGPMLVYDWADGELIATPAERRENSESSFQRFRRLPIDELLAALDTVLAVHLKLAREGWVASDFYDGSLLYDFGRLRLHLVDLDHYHAGPSVNRRGRMFGSRRFMAPEEFQRGAVLDERTTVFTLGRLISVFLCDGDLLLRHFRVNDARHAVMLRACRPAPSERYPGVAALVDAWRRADPAATDPSRGA